MLYQTLLALCLAPICLCSVFGVDINARYATFYDRDDCNIKEAGPRSKKDFKMSDDSCIRQSGRLSFWPGYEGTEGGDYCFVYYEDGDCVCIKGARRIHTHWKKEVECETEMVKGHTSYHFEKADKGTCPTKGCYAHDDVENTVEWEEVALDSQYIMSQ